MPPRTKGSQKSLGDRPRYVGRTVTYLTECFNVARLLNFQWIERSRLPRADDLSGLALENGGSRHPIASPHERAQQGEDIFALTSARVRVNKVAAAVPAHFQFLCG